jgi:hypothetical protein
MLRSVYVDIAKQLTIYRFMSLLDKPIRLDIGLAISARTERRCQQWR